MLTIDFIDEESLVNEKVQGLLTDLLNYAAKKENIESDAELSVTFVDNDQIQEINRTYRGKDKPTDVISFALEETSADEVNIIDGPDYRMLGDVIISIPKTKEQAEEYGHSFQRELGFLSVHGFLHLLGYDHMTDEDEKEMFARQSEILDEFGLSR